MAHGLAETDKQCHDIGKLERNHSSSNIQFVYDACQTGVFSCFTADHSHRSWC